MAGVYGCDWVKAGQWIGTVQAQVSGRIVLNLDSVPKGQLYGFLYYYPEGLPIGASIQIDESETFDGRETTYQVAYFDPLIGAIIDQRQVDLAAKFPGFSFPDEIRIAFSDPQLDENSLRLNVTFVDGTFVKVDLEKSEPPEFSDMEAENISWTDFKSVVTAYEPYQYLFRGQALPWSLQSSFHRTNRSCLHRFLGYDLQEIHRAVTSHTNHIFNLDRADELGAITALAQHHGYPTPLIDWSWSPYVAAWFAFEKQFRPEAEANRPVRILALDQTALEKFRSSFFLTYSIQHISKLESLAIENPRMAPQQGILTLTNVRDVERHIFWLEKSSGIKLLRAFDIPYFERENALRELRLMGITYGTLFPGIDSSCAELRSRNF
ncbi:FRG domain-containing protein [Sulfitobacter sp. F26204]|uniref:FRG domain-containing protein n=1 Tax=Sulfitobacter sp. F26204 TaxID=2996014 RepID=UPI00225E48A8|nr:FRG domain-containing protein [Sulfitobacter sp. F26204]MCX7559165.1 FRG domain-containing protein [Sulfitobacter sp. F26204]